MTVWRVVCRLAFIPTRFRTATGRFPDMPLCDPTAKILGARGFAPEDVAGGPISPVREELGVFSDWNGTCVVGLSCPATAEDFAGRGGGAPRPRNVLSPGLRDGRG